MDCLHSIINFVRRDKRQTMWTSFFNHIDRLAEVMTKRLRNYRGVVLGMAVIVVFITTYMLILPAVTLDQDAAEQMPGIDAQVEQTTQEEPAEPEKAEEPAAEEAEASETDEPEAAAEEPAEEEEAEEETESVEADEPKVEEEESEAEVERKTLFKYEDKAYHIQAETTEEANLPADAELRVTEIDADTEDDNGDKYAYQEYCDKALDAVRDADGKDGKKSERRVKLYDISFVVNGEEVEPEAPVKVTLTFDKGVKVNEKNPVRAVHFDESKEEMTAEVLDTEADIRSGKTMIR